MGNNSGEKHKKYGYAGTKRGRFNPNTTASNHVSCLVLVKSKEQKVKNLKLPKIIKTYVSKAKSFFAV